MSECFFSTDSTITASQIKELFEANNIKYFVKNLYIQNAISGSKLFIDNDLLAGKIEFYVEETDIEKANELINSISKRRKTKKKNSINDDVYNNMVEHNEIIRKSLLLSFCSFLIIPLFFNIEYLIKILKYKLGIGIFFTILSITSVFLGIAMISDNSDVIIMLNVIITPVLCFAKFLSLYKKHKIAFLFLIPVIIGIVIIFMEIYKSLYYTPF